MNNQESFEVLQNDIRHLLNFDNADNNISEILNKIISKLKLGVEGFKTDKEIEDFLDSLREDIESNNLGVPINLYPSKNGVGCRTCCVSISSLPFGEKRYGLKSGFKGTMLDMAAYWIHCIKVNKSTLIVTSDFVPRQFNELYKKIIDNYVSIHDKKVIVVEVSTTGIFRRY